MKTLEQIIYEHLRDTYLACFGCRVQTAKVLKISERTLGNYLRRYPCIKEADENRKDYRSNKLYLARLARAGKLDTLE